MDIWISVYSLERLISLDGSCTTNKRGPVWCRSPTRAQQRPWEEAVGGGDGAMLSLQTLVALTASWT